MLLYVMKKNKKYCFTLLEILLCLSLLSVIGAVFGVKGKQLFDVYQTREEIKKLRSFLQMIKLDSLAYSADIDIVFSKEARDWKVYAITHEPALLSMKEYQIPLVLKKLEKINGSTRLRWTSSGWLLPSDEIECLFSGKIEKVKPL